MTNRQGERARLELRVVGICKPWIRIRIADGSVPWNTAIRAWKSASSVTATAWLESHQLKMSASSAEDSPTSEA
jgi:hypothetical protein